MENLEFKIKMPVFSGLKINKQKKVGVIKIRVLLSQPQLTVCVCVCVLHVRSFCSAPAVLFFPPPFVSAQNQKQRQTIV